MRFQNPAQRRYTWRFAASMTLYAVMLLVAQHAIRTLDPRGATLAILSVLPALPLLAAIAVMGIYLDDEQDEYLRAVTIRGMTMATGLLLAICTVWGFLEQGGVVQHVPAWAAFPLWAVCLGVAQGYCNLRARSGRGA